MAKAMKGQANSTAHSAGLTWVETAPGIWTAPPIDADPIGGRVSRFEDQFFAFRNAAYLGVEKSLKAAQARAERREQSESWQTDVYPKTGMPVFLAAHMMPENEQAVFWKRHAERSAAEQAEKAKLAAEQAKLAPPAPKVEPPKAAPAKPKPAASAKPIADIAPPPPAAKGFKPPKEGSRKRQIYDLWLAGKLNEATAKGAELELAPTTLTSWFGLWRKGHGMPSAPRGSKGPAAAKAAGPAKGAPATGAGADIAPAPEKPPTGAARGAGGPPAKSPSMKGQRRPKREAETAVLAGVSAAPPQFIAPRYDFRTRQAAAAEIKARAVKLAIAPQAFGVIGSKEQGFAVVAAHQSTGKPPAFKPGDRVTDATKPTRHGTLGVGVVNWDDGSFSTLAHTWYLLPGPKAKGDAKKAASKLKKMSKSFKGKRATDALAKGKPTKTVANKKR